MVKENGIHPEIVKKHTEKRWLFLVLIGVALFCFISILALTWDRTILTGENMKIPGEKTEIWQAGSEKPVLQDPDFRLTDNAGQTRIRIISGIGIISLGIFCTAALVQTFSRERGREELAVWKEDGSYGEIISEIRHELKTPLAVICSYSELALELEKEEYENIRDILQSIRKESVNMAWITDVLCRSGKITDLETVHLTELTEECCREYRETMHYRIETEIEKGIYAKAAFRPLNEVLRCLIDNGIKYTNGDAPLEVMLCCRGEYAVISVRDHGIGIPKEEIPHLFEKNYRASNAADRPGNGYGLYFAKRLAECYGFDIRVKSELNRGSVFEIIAKTDLKKPDYLLF